MKVINRMIRRTIIEIVVVIAMVLISIPVWKSFDLEKYASVAMYYENMSYNYLDVSDYSDYILYQVNDEDAIKHIKPITLNLSNNSNTLEEYAVWMVVSKNSTLDIRSIKLNLDGLTKKLSDLEMYEDEETYYYLLFDGNLLSNNIIKDIKIWIDIDYPESIENKYLSFEFQNIQRQIL